MRNVVVITGGAGGMGLATAKIVGRDRFVVISDVNVQRLEAADDELAKLGIGCEAIACDISDARSVAQLVRTCGALGVVTSVIHTAGISPSMGAAELIMRVNALGTLHINEGFYPIAGDGFAIVNVASMAAHMLPRIAIPTTRFKCALHNEEQFMNKSMVACAIAPPRWRPALAYALSKSFVVWYCKSQADRFGRRGARIVSVSPGSIDTEMGRLEKASGAGAMANHAALRRFGTAEEVAQLLAFCASNKPGYLTGVDILCDGGAVASMTLRDKLAASRQD